MYTDIAQIECKHSSLRKVTTIRATQSQTPSLELVAADLVCRNFAKKTQAKRCLMCGPIKRGRKPTRRDRGEAQAAQAEAKPKRKGGGGPCRAFLSTSSRGRKFSSRSLQHLLQQYRHIKRNDPERFSELLEAGRLGTLAAQAWRFGVRSESCQRSKCKSCSTELVEYPVGAACGYKLGHHSKRLPSKQKRKIEENELACQEFRKCSQELVSTGTVPLPPGTSTCSPDAPPAAIVYPGSLAVVDFGLPANLLQAGRGSQQDKIKVNVRVC